MLFPSPHACYMPRHAILLGFMILIISGEDYMLRSSTSCSFYHPPTTSSLFGPNVLLSTLFSNTLSLCSSLNVRDNVSHPHRTTGKIIILYILMFTFLYGTREDKSFWAEWQEAFATLTSGLCQPYTSIRTSAGSEFKKPEDASNIRQHKFYGTC
jgi:hypothetical protein